MPHLATLRRAFDGAFDLARICAHTDERARDACERLGAEAFARGNAIAFASPDVSIHTVAHEVAHVVQQQAPRSDSGTARGTTDLEAAADEIADAAVRGAPIAPLLAPQRGTARNGRVQLKKALAPTLVVDTPVVATSDQQHIDGEDVDLRDTCDGRPARGCFLSESERLRLLTLIDSRLTTACENFRSVICEERIVTRLSPKADLWVLALEVFFAGAQIASGSLAGVLGIPKTRRLLGGIVETRGFTDIEIPDSVVTEPVSAARARLVNNAAKIVLAPAKQHFKGLAKKISTEHAKAQFLDTLESELGVQKDRIITEAMSKLDDRQRMDLATYYAPENHSIARYREALTKVLSTYQRDVCEIGKFANQVVVIEGPHGARQRRLAMCRKIVTTFPTQASEPVQGGAPHRYLFHHWIGRGFERLAEERQKVVSRPIVRPRTEASASLTVIPSNAPWLVDPKGEVAGWAEATTPRFVPATYQEDGSQTPEREEWPSRDLTLAGEEP